MKRNIIPSLAIASFCAILFSSCSTSRVYATKEKTPPQRSISNARTASYNGSSSLIISPHPGFRMSQNPDGRYFHRSPRGFIYWKGFDNRFYLDKNELRNVNYSKRDYKEWKKFSKNKR